MACQFVNACQHKVKVPGLGESLVGPRSTHLMISLPTFKFSFCFDLLLLPLILLSVTFTIQVSLTLVVYKGDNIMNENI